jgi:hypothetical protein
LGCVCVYPVFVLSCVQVPALQWSDHSSKESYRLCTEDYETEKEAKAQQRAVEPLMNEWMNEWLDEWTKHRNTCSLETLEQAMLYHFKWRGLNRPNLFVPTILFTSVYVDYLRVSIQRNLCRQLSEFRTEWNRSPFCLLPF